MYSFSSRSGSRTLGKDLIITLFVYLCGSPAYHHISVAYLNNFRYASGTLREHSNHLNKQYLSPY